MDLSSLNLGQLEQQYGLPSGLLSAVAQTESAGNPNAVSPKGAQGIFQFMPATAAQYGVDPTDPVQSAQGAAHYYSDLLKQNNGNLDAALASYNFGPGNVAAGKPLPQETQNYIAKVKSLLPTQVADSGQIMSDASSERPSLDDIFANKQASKPSLDEIFGDSTAKVNDSSKTTQSPGAARTLLDQGLQGASFGFADEVTDPLGATIAALKEDPLGFAKSIATGKTPQVSEGLNDAIANVRNDSKQRMAAEMQGNPLLSIGSNIAGALLTGGAGAETKAGSAIANFIGRGNTAARIAKGALAGAASGGLYGAGTADEGDRAQGAQQGAVSGALVGGAIPAIGASVSSLANGAKNAVQGALARSPEALQDAASSMKSAAGGLYNQMRQVGATLNPQATQNVIDDVKSAVAQQKFIPNLNPKTVAIIDDMEQQAKSGTLGVDELDQYRRLLGRVGGSEDGVSAGAARKAIDNAVSNLSGSQLSNGSTQAIDLLKQGRSAYARASKFEDISDILARADGDPNKIKSGLTRFLNNSDNLKGYTSDEVAALKAAAKSTTIEKLFKMGGKFGIDLGTSLTPGNTIAPLISGVATGSPIAPIAGTAARQAQKYLARGKAEALLKTIANGSKSSPQSSSISPLLSLLGGSASRSLPNYQQSVQSQNALQSLVGR